MQKLLLVDDDAEELTFMSRVAAYPGRQIIFAENREKALDILKQQSVDLVVADVALRSRGQDTDGFDILEAAKAKDAYLPVILITSYVTSKLGRRAVVEGAFDVIDRKNTSYEPYEMLRSKIDFALNMRQVLANANALAYHVQS